MPCFTKHSRKTHYLCFLFVILLQRAQAQQRNLGGMHDSSIAVPIFQGKDGQQDASSIHALTEYVMSTGLGRSESVTSQGNITIHPDNRPEQGKATLIVENSNRFRFDIQTSTGSKVSTRIDTLTGGMQLNEQTVSKMPGETALSGALITPWLLEALLKDKRLSVVTKGMVPVEGSTFLKVTLHRPLCLLAGCSPDLAKLRLTTDLYFDPQTHLLAKSVETVRLSDRLPARSLRVITYGDYRRTNQAVLPFEYEETLNGQMIWNFKATDVSLTERHDASYFRF